MQSKNTPYIARLDHLRACAVIFVAFFEFRNFMHIPPITNWVRIPLLEHGQSGVALFMVISGFIFAQIASRGEIDTWKFYLNRIIRIYPLFVTVVALGYFATPDPRPTQTGIDFLMALLPISNLYRLQYGQFGGMYWSVAAELQFYLLFPLLWLYIREWKGALALIGFLVLMRMITYIGTGAAYEFTYFSIFGALDLFVVGCLAHKVYASSDRTNSPWLPIGFLFLAAVVTYIEMRSSSRNPDWIFIHTVLGVTFAGLVVTYLRSTRELPFAPVFAFVGTVSYSIYVWQFFIFHAARNLIPAWATGDYLWGAIVLVFGVFPFAVASYYVIERPFLAIRVAYLKRASAARASAADSERLAPVAANAAP